MSEPLNTNAMNRTGSRSTRDLIALLTERDARILASIAEFRLLSTTQIRELHFAAHASADASIQACWAVLRRLEEHRLLQRVGRRRRFAGGGSTPVTWALNAAGERVIRFLAGEANGPRRRNLLPVGDDYHHTLAVADVYIGLVRAHRTGKIELLEAQAEPGAWRTHPGQLGRVITLKPDLALITQTPEYRDHWFAEVDLGHQSVPRLIRKCLRYEQYRASGIEQQKLGLFPRVLWILPDEHRVQKLRDAIAAEKHLRTEMFLVTVPEHLVEAICTGESPHRTEAMSAERRQP